MKIFGKDEAMIAILQVQDDIQHLRAAATRAGEGELDLQALDMAISRTEKGINVCVHVVCVGVGVCVCVWVWVCVCERERERLQIMPYLLCLTPGCSRACDACKPQSSDYPSGCGPQRRRRKDTYRGEDYAGTDHYHSKTEPHQTSEV